MIKFGGRYSQCFTILFVVFGAALHDRIMKVAAKPGSTVRKKAEVIASARCVGMLRWHTLQSWLIIGC